LSKKGKPEKVIKVAIAHKLVRQIFGVIKLMLRTLMIFPLNRRAIPTS
jgi:hypothetical protein